MKKAKTFLIPLCLVICFVLLDIAIFTIFTKPCLPDRSEGMQAKSIDLDKYLPFEEKSEIVKFDSEYTLQGDLPVIDGAAALYPVFSAFVNAIYPEDQVMFDGKNFTAESKLQMNNTRGSYKEIVDGDADIVFCAAPSEEQLAYAAEKNVELEMVPIGLEAFVFIVNSSNPVKNLSTDQIKGIYNGTYKFWSEVGGDRSPINPLHRNEGSGSQSAMLSFMNGEEMKSNPIGAFGRSIGFSFRYYVEDVVEKGNVKMLSVDGVYPSKENIINGSYPIVSNFYAVYDKNNSDPNIDKFIEWALSEEGQEIVEKTGYVPCRIDG